MDYSDRQTNANRNGNHVWEILYNCSVYCFGEECSFLFCYNEENGDLQVLRIVLVDYYDILRVQNVHKAIPLF